jgi:hypothetical protein
MKKVWSLPGRCFGSVLIVVRVCLITLMLLGALAGVIGILYGTSIIWSEGISWSAPDLIP